MLKKIVFGLLILVGIEVLALILLGSLKVTGKASLLSQAVVFRSSIFLGLYWALVLTLACLFFVVQYSGVDVYQLGQKYRKRLDAGKKSAKKVKQEKPKE